jgi:hypothetical protein
MKENGKGRVKRRENMERRLKSGCGENRKRGPIVTWAPSELKTVLTVGHTSLSSGSNETHS